MKIFKKFTVKRMKGVIYILSSEEVKKGDTVLAVSGYPHWCNFPQECTLVFPNGTIGLRKSVRVDKSCFRKISAAIRWHKWFNC